VAMKVGVRDTAPPDRAFGAFELRRLAWDTAHFGQKMGVLAIAPSGADRRLGALAGDLRLALTEATDDGYAHVIIRVPAEDIRVARVAEQSGMRLVDIAVDLSTTVAGRHALTVLGPSVRPAVPADHDALRSIAETAFEFSRFSADPFFSEQQVAGFYRQWTTNLCEGLAKVVLVAEASDEIAGFTSCSLLDDGTGRIPLIATSEAHRRQGVGRVLLESSLRWFEAAGVRTARVKTQVANYPAIAMYQRAGFTVATAELTFSAVLPAAGPIAR
jgi:ribosomal protein S18 acetylase RimI-like enzyme